MKNNKDIINTLIEELKIQKYNYDLLEYNYSELMNKFNNLQDEYNKKLDTNISIIIVHTKRISRTIRV